MRHGHPSDSDSAVSYSTGCRVRPSSADAQADRRVTGQHVNRRALNVLGVTTAILMTLAAVVLVVG
jgi:hypothetical protein